MVDQHRFTRRVATLMEAMGRAGLDVVALVPSPNFFYLTGARFPLRARPTLLLIDAAGGISAIMPSLERTSWMALGIEAEVHWWDDSEGYEDAFRRAFNGRPPLKIGVEGQKMRVFELRAIERNAVGSAVIDAHTAISSMRMRKDADEIAAMRKAIALTETALEATLERIRIGMSEREIQALLLKQAFAADSDGLAYPVIVAAGANSAASHAKAGEYRLRAGDALLFDFGLAWHGYNADITRTFFAGAPTAEDRALYETVLEANSLGRRSARPGITGGALDETVLAFLKESPFSQFVRHRTGHGLGIDVHEEPYIQRGVSHVLEPGNLFTIEPGLYVPGRLGVRIEDDVVVTETGAESLTTISRELRTVG